MILVPERIRTREKLILTGIYLLKYGALGLKKVGFRTYAEAYNVIGFALGSGPSSIKNYRDEFVNNQAEMRLRQQAANLGFQLMPVPETES